MRSAWIKWARAVEHQRVLARLTREFEAADTYEYVRWDNAGDANDPLLRAHWRLKIKVPYSERWSVLLGDIFTNLRAALDHMFWAAVVAHSGQPARPNRVQFPIATDAAKFHQTAAELGPLVTPDFWSMVEGLQPHHAGSQVHTTPLEILRWLSNVDKHRFVHVIGRTSFDLGSVTIRSESPVEVVEDWRHEGPVEDNDVVALLKVKRPLESSGSVIELTPVFAYTPTIQISENPVQFRALASAMDVMSDVVLRVLSSATSIMGLPMPDPDGFELGAEHEAVAPDYGGNIAIVREHDGTIRPIPLPTDESDSPGS